MSQGPTRRARLPQQDNDPSLRSPHECAKPVLTAEKDPDGAADCPWAVSPQQVIHPSLRNPHECQPPAATAVREPDGSADCP